MSRVLFSLSSLKSIQKEVGFCLFFPLSRQFRFPTLLQSVKGKCMMKMDTAYNATPKQSLVKECAGQTKAMCGGGLSSRKNAFIFNFLHK